METSNKSMGYLEAERGEIEMSTTRNRYPYCLVWTPIPCLTWLFPFVGHMGICMSNGVIRDFAGPYFVSEDNMAFGNPTRYIQLNVMESISKEVWDRCVYEASEVYKTRMHNLCCDNCHSHVALALNKMNYNNSSSWNMFKLAAWMFFKGKFVGVCGVLKTFTPFVLVASVLVIVFVILDSHS